MYRISLKQFEGPLDLLLFFIRRDELSITDIPVAQIADEYLTYVRLLKQVDLNGAGEFIYMAAYLISLKAQMLLPREAEAEDEVAEDPRVELAQRLREYLRFKEAASRLDERHSARSLRFDHRARADASAAGEEETPEGSLFDLIAALGRVLAAAPAEPVHAVAAYDYSVEKQQQFVMDLLVGTQALDFAAMVRRRSKAFVIATFLAILELARKGELFIALGPGEAGFAVRAMRADQGVQQPLAA